jgi:hypothetical protein
MMSMPVSWGWKKDGEKRDREKKKTAADTYAVRLAGVNHEAVNKLHGLGTGAADLARHNELAALGASLCKPTNVEPMRHDVTPT